MIRRPAFKFTRIARERAHQARFSGLAKEIPVRRLTKEEIARDYSPEKVAGLLKKANTPSAQMSPEDLGLA